MCRMLGFVATHPTRLDCALVDAPHSLLAQSREDLEGFSHADGWGIAQWGEDGVSVIRHLAAAHEGEDYLNFARSVRAPKLIAHVRQATAGDVCFENTHPFVSGPWVFVHNGTIRHFQEGVRDRMWLEIAPDRRRQIQGNTDSEALFQLLLSRLDKHPDQPALDVIAGVIRDIVDWCAESGPCENLGLTMMLSDGDRFYGARWQQSLWMLQRDGRRDTELCDRPPDGETDGYHALLIASEPLTDEDWQAVPECCVFEIEPHPEDPSMKLRFRMVTSE